MARFTNQAQIRYGDAVSNSNIAVGEILEVLSVTKTAVRNTYGQNDSVTYIVSIVNAGTVPFTGITVTDNLGAYPFGGNTLVPLTYIAGTAKYYVNGVVQATPAVTAGPPLVVAGLTIPANGNITLIYEAAVNRYAPLSVESSVVNTVTVSGNGITAVQAEETIQAESAPVLMITKSVSPVPVTENGTLTYTFLIQNIGNVAAEEATGVIVTDQFDPILSNLAVSFNGTAFSSPADYTYNEATGAFSTVAGQVTVPAASFVQDAETGVWSISPGVSTLVITGTI